MSTTHLLVLLSVLLAVVVIAVLAIALTLVRNSLEKTSAKLATLAGALEQVDAAHLSPLEGAVTEINNQFDQVLELIPGIARKAAVVAERRTS
jgi:Tfp pilus assembly major pilin PilA